MARHTASNPRCSVPVACPQPSCRGATASLLGAPLVPWRVGSHLLCLIAFGAILVAASTAWAWGRGHRDVTEGALRALPHWEKDLLGKELDLLGRQHCFIPDQVYARKEIQKYAMMDSKPNTVYLVELHLPPEPTQQYEVLRYFMRKAVE